MKMTFTPISTAAAMSVWISCTALGIAASGQASVHSIQPVHSEASKIGTVFLYVLIATIGMHMDLKALVDKPWLFLLGAIWILTHGLLLFIVAKLIKAPLFFAAVGSQANIGAAASAPVVASAFHPSLAPVAVLLAVFGYALGTYCAYITGILLRGMAG